MKNFAHWFSGFTDASFKKPSYFRNMSKKINNTLNNFTVNPNNKEIVIWGTNLNSAVGLGKFSNIISKTIQLTNFHFSVVIGLILSDGWLSFASKLNKNARLGLKQSLNSFEYLWSVFIILSHYSSSFPILIKGKRNNAITYGVQFFTRSLPCFTKIHNLFYVNKVKAVPQDIYNLLTPIALAHWIMGDGSVQRHGLIICTDSFTTPVIIKLINVLIIKFELDCSIKYHTPTQPRIYIKQRSMVLLRKLIVPHMHPSMLYKLNIRN